MELKHAAYLNKIQELGILILTLFLLDTNCILTEPMQKNRFFLEWSIILIIHKLTKSDSSKPSVFRSVFLSPCQKVKRRC